jgi:hypothetical protein
MTGKKAVRANAIRAEEETALWIRTETESVMTERETSVPEDAIEEEEMKTSRFETCYIRRILPPLVFLLLLFPLKLSAQFSLSTGLDMSFNDNINSNYQSLSDEVSELFLDGSYDFSSKYRNLELYYEGSLSYFNRNVSRTYHEHSAGLNYSNSFGKNSNSSLSLGASYRISLNRDDYSYLDYSKASAFAKFKTYVSKRVQWQIGYVFDYFNYNEISDLNDVQNYVYTSFTGFLPSRTSLGIETGFGMKNYVNSFSAVTNTTGINGMGGMDFMGGNGSGMGGYRMGSSSTGTDRNVMKLDITGKISQSIFDRTGLSFTAGYSKNLKSDERFLISGNVTGSNNVFDDEYSFEGPFVESSLTQRFPWNVAAVISAGYQNRIYVDRPAYDLNENILSNERTDKVFTASLQITRNFRNFGISLVYSHINNSTNDAYYNFENNIISLELGAGF